MALPLRDDAPTKRVPWVTYALILTNIVVFLFLQPAGFQHGSANSGTKLGYQEEREALRFTYEWGAVPCEVMSGRALADRPHTCHDRPARSLLDPAKGVLLALLTSMFLHGGIAHLAGNMLFLWVFGNNVEDRLGPLPFLAFYLVGGIAAAMGFVLSNVHGAEPLVGASGAIAAVMGAYLVFRPRGRILVAVSTAAFQVVYVPAFVVLGLFFVTQFFTPAEDHVAWQAHAAGMAFGVLAGLLLARLFKDPFRDGPGGATSAVTRAGSAF
ncbi:MAG: putative rane protein [Acidimicrobiales bacterium]|nr:putative rane protein [Acidimicrobiales bacterium]